MKSRKLLKAVVSIFSLSFVFGSLPLSTLAEETTQPVLVVYKNADGKEAVLDEANKVNEQFKHVPAVEVSLTKKDIATLKKDKDILSIEPNILLTISDTESITPVPFNSLSTSTDSTIPTEESQWGLQAIQAPLSWKEGYTGKDIKVGVVDTGIASHPDLTVYGGISTVDYTTSYTDDNGHGTHVAGIVGAKQDSKGMVGVAPNAQLYAIKVMNQDGDGYLSDLVKGIDWAISQKLDILNMSLGTTTDSPLLEEAVEKAYQSGIIVVGASGNSGNDEGTGDSIEYPAKYPHVVSVSAVDKNYQRASFSSTGEKIDLSAGGVGIISTYLQGQYASASGTSQATPHVTGLLALVKQQFPTKTNEELVTLLKSYAKDLGESGKDTWYGTGLALYQTTSVPTPPPAPTMTPTQLKLAINKATQYVGYAERHKTQAYVDLAQQYINELPDTVKEKATLQKRLDTVVAKISAQLKLALDKATQFVGYAERTKTKALIDMAQKYINALPDTVTEKMALQKRLDVVKAEYKSAQLKQAIGKATQFVGYAERYKNNLYAELAQRYVSALPDSVVEKSALQKRLDAVKAKSSSKK